MRLSADALAARLAAPGAALPPVIWLHGDEPLLALEAADAVRRAACAAGYTEREVVVVDRHFKAAALASQAGALSLFAERRLVEVRFGAAKPGKEASAAVAAFARDLGDDLRLLVTSARLNGAALRSEAIGLVERAGWLVGVEPIERARLPQWVRARLAAQSQRVDDATLALLVERVEGNLLAAHQEVQKLALLCPPGEVPFDAVRAAVLDVSRFDALDAVEAMLLGDAPRTVRALDALRAEGEPPQRLLWWLADAIRKVARLHDARARGTSFAQAAPALQIWRGSERPYQAALTRIDARTARGALLRAAEIDRIGKGVADGDAWQAILALASELAGAPALGAAEQAQAG